MINYVAVYVFTSFAGQLKITAPVISVNENKLCAMNITAEQPVIRDNKRAVDGNCNVGN